MKKIRIAVISAVLSAIMLSSTLSASTSSVYKYWNLYYTGTTTGSHLGESFQPPVHDKYSFISSSYKQAPNQDTKTRVIVNGVFKYMNTSGVIITFPYSGVTKPTVQLQLMNYTGGVASMGGRMEVIDN